MPSMLTAPTMDGKTQTLREFMLEAAHLMSMFRPLDGAPLPEEFNVDPCFVKMLNQSKAKLEELKALSLEQWATLQRTKHDEHELRRHTELAEIAVRRERIEARLSEVIAWTPPSNNHRDFKAIVIRQLEGTLKSDCNTTPWEQPLKLQSIEQYRNDALAAAEHELASITRMYEESVKAAAYRTRWARELVASLPDDTTEFADNN